MPSQSQINEFFIQTVEDKYKDKNGINLKPGSVIAALGENGKLSWAEVAEKFKNESIAGHIQLKKGERSYLSAVAAKII